MNIPKEFQIFGRKITTEWNDKDLGKLEAHGTLNNITGIITLPENALSGYDVQATRTEQLYCHEVIHAFVNETDYNKKLSDCFDDQEFEQFVEIMGKCLHQFLITKK